MSRVFVTGDLHGSIDIRKLSSRGWPEGKSLSKDDYLVVCGDFGLVWSDPPAAEDEYWLKWLEGRPWTTLFIDGNHENHDLLDAMPVSEWRGGKVHVLPGYPSIIHLMRGQVYDMGENGRWFTFGGATSHDIEYRTPYVSWWPREMPSTAEYEEGLANLERVDYQVDYVFTHDVPASRKEAALFGGWDDSRGAEPDALNRYLQQVCDGLDRATFKRWYCGHYHDDSILGSKRYVLLYQQVVELGGVPAEPPLWEAVGRTRR